MNIPAKTVRLKAPSKKPGVPKYPIFLGVHIDKQTSQALTRAARAEKASRSFVVRKLLTDILSRYELETSSARANEGINNGASSKS